MPSPFKVEDFAFTKGKRIGSMSFEQVIKASIPDGDAATIDHALWGRTPFPFANLTARDLFKAADRWRRACAGGKRLCGYCDRIAIAGAGSANNVRRRCSNRSRQLRAFQEREGDLMREASDILLEQRIEALETALAKANEALAAVDWRLINIQAALHKQRAVNEALAKRFTAEGLGNKLPNNPVLEALREVLK